MAGWEAYIDTQLLLKSDGVQTDHSPINFGAIVSTDGAIVADQGFHITQDEATFLSQVVKAPEFKDEYKAANAFKHGDSVGSYTLGGVKYVVSRADDGVVLSSCPSSEGGCIIGVSATMIILAHVYAWSDQTEVQSANVMVAGLKTMFEEMGY